MSFQLGVVILCFIWSCSNLFDLVFVAHSRYQLRQRNSNLRFWNEKLIEQLTMFIVSSLIFSGAVAIWAAK